MYNFRVTAKVGKQLKMPLLDNHLTPTTLLGDWYVNLLIIQKQQVLLLVSERTLLPVLIQAKDLARFPLRFPSALREMLRALKISDAKIDAELNQMMKWGLAKTASRQVLGSMNDFANMLEAYIDDGRPLLVQALRLAQAPCGPIKMNSPIHETAALFGETISFNPYSVS